MLGVKTLFARVFKRQKKGRRFRLVQQFGAGNPNLSMGYGSYMSKTDIHCWRDGFSITVGRYCSLATNLTFILGGEHDINWVSTYPFINNWNMAELSHINTPKCRGNIVIEDDVWIGHGVTILSGTTIETGAVVGAGAVVRGKISPYSIVVGNPGRVIRRRFDDHLCDDLLASRWWELDKDQLAPLVQYMNDPKEFLAKLRTAL